MVFRVVCRVVRKRGVKLTLENWCSEGCAGGGQIEPQKLVLGGVRRVVRRVVRGGGGQIDPQQVVLEGVRRVVVRFIFQTLCNLMCFFKVFMGLALLLRCFKEVALLLSAR